jgi:hypothetical protein
MDYIAALPAEILSRVAERLVSAHAQGAGDSLIRLIAASPAAFRTLYKEREWRHELRRFICSAPSVDEAAKEHVARPRDWEFGQTVDLALHSACGSCGVLGARACVSLRVRVCALCREWFLCPEDEAAALVEGGAGALQRLRSVRLKNRRSGTTQRHYLYSHLSAVPALSDPWQHACGGCGNMQCNCDG